MEERLKETLLESAVQYRGRIINVRQDRVRTPAGKDAFREVVEHPGAVYDRRVIIFSSNQCQNIEFPEYVKVKTPENLSVENILKELAKEGIDSLLIEGGASVFSQFLPYADEVYGFYATKVFGKGKSIFEHLEIPVEESEIPFEIQNFKNLQEYERTNGGDEKMFTGIIQHVCKGYFDGKRLIIENPWRCPKDSSHCVVIGESISVNGACLTVVKVDETYTSMSEWKL